jgi:hypothetical protein
LQVALVCGLVLDLHAVNGKVADVVLNVVGMNKAGKWKRTTTYLHAHELVILVLLRP